MKIEGKCALVTGGANGIGINIVRNLLKRGAKVRNKILKFIFSSDFPDINQN